jgi:hypothetical protein
MDFAKIIIRAASEKRRTDEHKRLPPHLIERWWR